MVKKMISRLSVLAVLTVFLVACSKQTEYTNVIPVNASIVASVNLKSLASKAGLDSKENEAAKQKLLDAMKSGMNAATFQQVEKIIGDPSASGLDPQAPIYIFTSTSFPSGAFVAKVNSEDDLKTAFEVMAKEQICDPIEVVEGYNFTTISGNLVAFNSAVIILAPQGTASIEETQKEFTTMMKQTVENSINKSGAFKQMEEQENDINFFASMAAIPAPYSQQISMGLPADIEPEDITIIGGLNFEKGKIVLKMENYSESEAVKALLKKQQDSFGKTNNTFVKYFPASTLVFFNIGVKGEGLYNLLNENQEFRNTVSIAKAAEVKELFSSFNGDMSAGLLNVTMNSAPTFVAYAEVKNSKALEAIYKNKKNLGLKNGEDIIELSKDEYVYKMRNMNVFFGVKNKQMYATNDELIYKNIDKVADKSVKDAPYASDIKGKNTFIAINTEEVLNLPVVKMLVGFGGEEFKTYFSLASKFSYVTITSEGETNKTEICLKDKNVNALKQFVDFAKQFAGM